MKTLTFKVSEDEEKVIRLLAKEEKTSLSEYLRRRATGRTRSGGPLEQVRCDLTGAMIFAPTHELTPLTNQTVREMLSDFP
jgi:hypothetical protein